MRSVSLGIICLIAFSLGCVRNESLTSNGEEMARRAAILEGARYADATIYILSADAAAEMVGLVAKPLIPSTEATTSSKSTLLVGVAPGTRGVISPVSGKTVFREPTRADIEAILKKFGSSSMRVGRGYEEPGPEVVLTLVPKGSAGAEQAREQRKEAYKNGIGTVSFLQRGEVPVGQPGFRKQECAVSVLASRAVTTPSPENPSTSPSPVASPSPAPDPSVSPGPVPSPSPAIIGGCEGPPKECPEGYTMGGGPNPCYRITSPGSDGNCSGGGFTCPPEIGPDGPFCAMHDTGEGGDIPHCAAVDNDACFSANTKIRMADKTQTLVSQIKIGDRVWNPITRRPARVVRVTKGKEWDRIVELHSHGKTLRVNGQHPMLTRRGVVPAEHLVEGDLIKVEGGKFAAIQKLTLIWNPNGEPLYNLELAGGNGKSPRIDDHMVLANGVITGDLTLQKDLLDTGSRHPAVSKK